MRRTILILAFLLALVPAAIAVDADDLSARAYQIRFKTLPDAVELIADLLSEDGSVSIHPRLNRMVVQDRLEVLDRVAAVLEDFDQPPVNVDVTVSLFLGSDSRDEEAVRHANTGSISREVRGITETLGDFTKWTSYDPIGSRSVTCSEGSRVTVNLSEDYRVVFFVDAVEEKLGKVKFSDFTLQKIIRTAAGTERYENQYTQGIVLPIGRLLVVGAARDPGSRKALFLSLQVRSR